MRRNLTALLALIAVFAAGFVFAQQPAGKEALEQARTRKTAGDLQGAVELLEGIVSNSASDRNAAANALLEMGGIAESLGQSNKARNLYERVRTDFKDQATEAGIAARKLSAATAPGGQPSNGTTPGNPSKVVIRTPYADDVYSFAISPDGRTLVLQATSPDGKRQLWRQAVDPAQKPEPIAGTEGAGASSFPFFSSDGRTVGFFAKQKLWQVDLAGGTPKEIADAPSPWGGSWTDGNIVFSGRGIGGPIELLQGGRITPLTGARGFFMSPKFVDDRRFLYFSRDARGGGRIEVGSIEGGQAFASGLPAPAHAVAFSQGYLLYVTPAGVLNALRFDPKTLAAGGPTTLVAERVGREDRLLGVAALSVSAAGPIAYREIAVLKKQLMWMDRAGDLVGTIGTPDSASPGSIRLGPDGRTVLHFRQTGSPMGSIWASDTETGAQVQIADGAPSAMWSPKGDRIILSALRQGGGVPLLAERPASAGVGAGRAIGPQSGTVAAFPEDWAANGAVLYRVGNGGGGLGGGDLFVLTSPEQTSSIAIAQTPATERNGRFSPDSNWIAYQSDESGRNEVYVQPFPGTLNERQRVSLNGGSSPQWGRNGRELYFLGADNRLMIATAESAQNGEKRSIEIGTPKPLLRSPLPQGAEYDTARDGDRFLILAPVEEYPPIIVLSNWTPGR